MAREMGADLIAPGGGKVQFEPQRMYNWALILPPDLGMGEDTHVSVESITLPNINIEPIVLAYLNEDRKVPGAVTFEQATLVIRDFIQPDVMMEWMKWFQEVYDFETGGIGRAADIKKDIQLDMFGPKEKDLYERSRMLVIVLVSGV